MAQPETPVEDGRRSPKEATPTAPFARMIGRTRFVVLLGVAAVLLVSMALFVLGAAQAVVSVWHALQALLRGEQASSALTVELLEVVASFLKAVVFYIVGVGLYSLFIAPLNVTAALGVETLNDLETKVVGVVVVIMSITFLEHFIAWKEPAEMLMWGGTLALVVVPLVLFQFYLHYAKEGQKQENPGTQDRAKQGLFERDQEKQDVAPVGGGHHTTSSNER